MGRPITLLLIVLAAVGGWFFFGELASNPYAFMPPVPSASPPISGGWGHAPRPATGNSPIVDSPIATGRTVDIPDLMPRDSRYVRVASFNMELQERTKAEDAGILHRLATILAQFDIVAIQGVAAQQSHTLGVLVDSINSSGRKYEYVMGPRVGREKVDLRQFAFVFDTERVEVDGHELYTVEDPDDLIRWEPFVAWFRTRGPRREEAFTFTLVNVCTDPLESDRENSILSGIFREVRNDQRREDDVIIAGCFSAEAKELEQLTGIPNPNWSIQDMVTDTGGTAMLDNIFSSRSFTDEATGRVGVLDFLRQLNLSLDQAIAISGHLPVWAEFSMVEGGTAVDDAAPRPADPFFPSSD